MIYQRAFTGNPAAWTDWKSPTRTTNASENASYESAKIDASEFIPRLFVYVNGKTVNVRGEFQAATDISNQAEAIAHGLPVCAWTATSGTFFGINQTTGKPLLLDVNMDGDLVTYFVGAISRGDVIRFSGTYFTT